MKFRKKPVVVYATQWIKAGDHPAVEMCWFDANGRIRWAPGDPESINVHGCTQQPAIRTLEGWHEVTAGDWIIAGIRGEFYPCKPDIFKETYKLVED